MTEVALIIESSEWTNQVSLTEGRLTIGRGDKAELIIEDQGLSRLHASIYREGDRIWILDECSTNGSYVNGRPVPPSGTPLVDGDEISIGDQTTLMVSITHAKTDTAAERPGARAGLPSLPLIVTIMLVAGVLIGAVVLGSRLIKSRAESGQSGSNNVDKKGGGSVTENRASKPSVEASNSGSSTIDEIQNDNSLAGNANSSVNSIPDTPSIPVPQATSSATLYRQMSEEQKLEFVDRRARHISLMMSNREYTFTPETLGYIKEYLDNYARRVGNNSQALWGEDLRFLLGRATGIAPKIIGAFRERGVPPVVGLYIVMIETEYRECLVSPVGAKGLFQFMPDTARGYGVDPNDRCDVNKMAPAASKYIQARITEFGTDSMSVALGIAGYNRSPDSIRRDLQDSVDPGNQERSFWTLVANKEELDHFFQKENVRYVPKFFAAAIVGETPLAFGLQMKPLSTYSEETDKR